MDKPKTVKEYLQMLNSPEREQALNNLRSDRGEEVVPDLSSAIDRAFGWGSTPQGREYWRQIYDSVKHKTYEFNSQDSNSDVRILVCKSF